LLHKLTVKDTEMRMFLCFSSVTAALGTAGQAAYGASNRYLERLMTLRTQQGQAGCCIRWPEVSCVGMAAALHGSSGEGSRPCAVSVAQVENFLQGYFASFSTSPSTLTWMPTALVEMYRNTTVAKQLVAVMDNVAPTAPAAVTTGAGAIAAPAVVAAEYQIRSVMKRILTTLIDDAADGEINDDALLMQTAGLDSLGATELSSQLGAEYGLKVPPTLIFSYPTVNEIVSYLHGTLAAKAAASSPHPPAPSGHTKVTAPATSAPLQQLGSTALAPTASAVTLDDVAIIGTSLSFPGNCNTLDRLWEILLTKESTSVNTPADRWDVDALLAANNIRDDGCRARLQKAHFLTHEEPFNPQQFNMTAKEAEVMHPTHRLLLVNCQRALDDAGYGGADLCANTGVYVGIGGVVSGTGSAAAAATEKTTASRQPTMSAYSATSHSVSVSSRLSSHNDFHNIFYDLFLS
jgi:acyl carrier protein